jgi:hypothetical protein
VIRALRLIAGLTFLAGLACASMWAVRVAWADYSSGRETIDGQEKALRLVPDNAEYEYRLALLTAGDDHARSSAALRRAAALSPADARLWITMGLDEEAAGNFAHAEQSLLRAAAEDRQYLPRWTLVNFYFRRGDFPRFWQWARSAAEVVYDGGVPLFRLCTRVADQGDLIERLAIARPEVRAAYVEYQLHEGRLDTVMPAVRTLIPMRRDADVPLLMEACDRLLEAGRSENAMEVWNALAAARRIPFAPLAAGRSVVTNGRFATDPTSAGFDWRLPGAEGVSVAREDQSGGLRLTFSGAQPESADVLAEFVPVGPNTEYALSFRYQTAEVPPGSGLAWRVLDGNGGELAATGSLFAGDETEGTIRFRTPDGCGLVRLTLTYRRPPGVRRIAGYVVLREVEVHRPG